MQCLHVAEQPSITFYQSAKSNLGINATNMLIFQLETIECRVAVNKLGLDQELDVGWVCPGHNLIIIITSLFWLFPVSHSDAAVVL